ncbi:MAG TPA: outer membrane protein assembly factor BamA [Rectinemataceae bacterium]|nr:outer membrane protein assembly factor BamA [Rectinemataceae bacterium]
MKRSFLAVAFACAALSLFAQTEWFWNKPIAGVQWVGVTHADKKALDALAGQYVGKVFTQDLWTDLQGRVYELDWFDTIDPQAFPANDAKTEVVIKIVVKEKPAVGHIRVEGNSGIHATDILDAAKVKVGDIYNAQAAKLDELAIKQLYLGKGYTEATVTSTVSAPDSRGELNLTFVVNEGSTVAVRSIRFTGNLSISEKTLKAALSLKEMGLFQDGSFQESKLEDDKQKIIDLYRARGFVDAAVKDVVRSYSKDPKKNRGLLDLTFVISEGKIWTLDSVSFEGNKIFSTARLASFISLKPGQPVNYGRLLADKQRIDDLYYENGYIFNTLDLVEKRDADRGNIAYTIKIVERDRALIESITFKGNTKSKEKVLFRELPFQVGDVFSKAKVVEGLRNLYNLQYFSSVEPDMKPGSADGLMDLTFNVQEQSTADIQFGVTLSGLGDPNAFPVSGLLKWSDKNFLGNGQNFSVALNAAPDDQSLTFSFLDNWLLGRRLTGGIDLSFDHKTSTTPEDMLGPIFADGVPDPYTSYEDYKSANYVVPSAYLMPYTLLTFSLGFNTGYGWTMPNGNYGVGLGVSTGLTQTTYDATLYRPAIESIRTSTNEWLFGNKLSGRVYINTLDNWVNPTKGYFASEKLTFGGLFGFEPEHYLRSDTNLQAFLTLLNIPVIDAWSFKLVLGAHSGLQLLMPEPGSGLSTPVVTSMDSLHIDGTFNARGWHSLYAVDGTQLWENWLELRMPVFESVLWFDGFFDAAALNTSYGLLRPDTSGYSAGKDLTGLSWDNLALSAGFGFRFTIAQFPFRFYFAKRMLFDGKTLSYPSDSLDFVISISQALQ